MNKRRNAESTLKTLREEKSALDSECLKIEEKINQIQLNLNKIKSELDYLQLVKQKKINELTCSFIITLSQVYSQEIPMGLLSSQVLFTEEQFKQLKQRIQNLKSERDRIFQEKK